MIATESDAVTVCLYVAITAEAETQTVSAPWPRRLKSLTKHSLDRVATKLSHRLHFDIHHYETAYGLSGNSNRGDIAIRMAIKQQLRNAFAPRPVAFLEVRWGELTGDRIQEINHSCDIFVIGGGGYMFINADGSVGHMLQNVEKLKKSHCPVFAYGIGLNRLMHEKVCDVEDLPESSRRKIRYLAEKCALISVRDFETAKLFELYSGKPVTLTGDPVLSAVVPMNCCRDMPGRISWCARCCTPVFSPRRRENRSSISPMTRKVSPSESCWAFPKAVWRMGMPICPSWSGGSRLSFKIAPGSACGLRRARRSCVSLRKVLPSSWPRKRNAWRRKMISPVRAASPAISPTSQNQPV